MLLKMPPFCVFYCLNSTVNSIPETNKTLHVYLQAFSYICIQIRPPKLFILPKLCSTKYIKLHSGKWTLHMKQRCVWAGHFCVALFFKQINLFLFDKTVKKNRQSALIEKREKSLPQKTFINVCLLFCRSMVDWNNL